jgi:predicted phage terminase large subunit-like protein
MMGSELFPSWYLGHHPNHKVMGASHTGDLAEGFGRKVRNHIDSRDYQQIFPATKLSKDSTAAGRWSTSAGGEAFYAGVGAALAGKGGDLVVVDDPHNEQDIIAGTDTPFDKAYTWFLAGPRQRLQANAVILILHTRWSKRDIIGRVLEDAAKNADADQYEYLELPMELPSGAPLWPEMWTLEAIKKLKASLLPHLWAAQYQQRPIGLGKTFINESDFKRWTRDKPPLCDYIMLTLDAAVEKTTRSDYNVFQTWGVFTDEHIRDPDTQEKMPQLILLDVVRERLEFPELKMRAREVLKAYQPDLFTIEKKANGAPLIHELRRSGIPVTAYDPGTLDKVARLNAVVDIIKSGLVWLPEFAWADQFIEEVCGFPNEAHDDQVDALSQSLHYFRKGGFIALPHDPKDEDDNRWYKKPKFYGCR